MKIIGRPINSIRIRQGMIMIIFLCAILALAVLTTYFMFVTSNAQLQTNVLRMKGGCQFLVENAVEEAYSRLSRAIIQPASPEFKWFVEASSSPLSIDTPLTTKVASQVAPGAECAISVSARIVEKRKISSLGKKYSDDMEGLGSFELNAVVTLQSRMAGKTVRRAISHHDFRVASVVNKRDNRKNRELYTNNFICDYILFIRNGVQEFVESDGKLLNRAEPLFKLNVDVDPWKNSKIPMEYFGKVFLGDRSADGKLKHVFLNTTDETFKTLVPGIGFTRIAQKDHCLQLFPLLEEYADKLDGLVGYYMGNALPARGDYILPTPGLFTPDQVEKLQNRARKLAEAQFTSDLERNLEPGMDIIPPDIGRWFSLEYAQSLLEGDIRQRFFYNVHFFLEFMHIADQEYVVELNNKTKHDLDGHFPVVEVGNPSEMGDFSAFYEEFPKLDDKWVQDGNYSLRGTYEDWFSLYHYDGDGMEPTKINHLYRGDNSGILGEVVSPAFYSPDHERCESAKNTLPLQLYELYSSTFKTTKAFYSSSYFRTEGTELILSLNGPILIRSSQPIILGGPDYSAVRIEGRGSIVAKGGFKILSPILKRENYNSLVLFAIGEGSVISLETELVEAGLVAMNKSLNGRIVNEQPVTIRGFYACDRMLPSWNGADWPANQQIELYYDPGFKSPVETLYTVGISRAPVLYRITGDDE